MNGFPSPCRGLIFLTIHTVGMIASGISFRPLAGDLSSLPILNQILQTKLLQVSVPLQGTYLPYLLIIMKFQFLSSFPSPCRGLIFLTRHSCRSYTVVPSFPSPCRGLIFLTSLLLPPIIPRNFSVPLQGTYLPYPRPRNTRVFVCFHCTLRGKKKISLSSSFFSCSTLAKWPIFSHRGKFL